MNLFDKFERTYMGMRAFGESKFEFLNRSARGYAPKAREMLEEWFSHYDKEAGEKRILKKISFKKWC